MLRINESDLSTLLLIEAPTYSNKCKSKYQTYELLDSYGVSHFELLENIDPSSLWFHNSGHMSQFGAVIASIETAQFLSEKLDIAMNQVALEDLKATNFGNIHSKKMIKVFQLTLFLLMKRLQGT